MSTKTTFKRIALVAVAALGLGVLSVAPSQATVSALTVTGANGTSTLSASAFKSDSTTAASVTVSGLVEAQDSVTVTFVTKSVPSTTTSSASVARMYYLDSTTASRANSTIVETSTSVSYVNYADSATPSATAAARTAVKVTTASDTSGGITSGSATPFRVTSGTVGRPSNTGYVGAKFVIQLDSTTTRVAGTYTYTAIVKTYENGGTTPTQTLTQDVSIVVADTDANIDLVSGTISSALTTAVLNGGSADTGVDSVVAAVATASSDTVATLRVKTYSAAGNPAPESVTVTVTGPGLICDSTPVCGKSITKIGTGGSTTFTVRADGTAGVASIVVATTTKTFAAKTVTFYAKAAKTITAVVNKAVIGATDASSVIIAKAVDANGNSWAGTAYIVASSAADALVAGSTTPVACAYSSALDANVCPVSGSTVGTAKFKVIDASTVALATATSNEVSVKVSAAAPATVKLAFDKSTYAPGERAVITATVLDADGNAIPTTAITNLFAAGGIVSNVTLTKVGNSNDLATVTQTVRDYNDATTDPTAPYTAGAVTYLYTMPITSGDVVLTATGGTGLALAGRVAVTAKATVVNSSVDAATDAANEATDAANAATDAALAAADAADAATAAAQDASDAVAALSATVAKLVASLKAQITSLTNLVIKIQKKVKA